MSGIVAIGERERVQGFAFAGVAVIVAGTGNAVREAWRELPEDGGLVILTAAARAALAVEELRRQGAPLAVVMPE